MPSQPIHIAANGTISLFFTPHLLYPSSVHGHLDCFHVLAISFHFFWIGTPRMESLVHMVILCLVWRPLSAAVHSGHTISHSLLQCTRAPTSTSSPVPSTFLSFLPFSLPPSPPFFSFFLLLLFPFPFLSFFFSGCLPSFRCCYWLSPCSLLSLSCPFSILWSIPLFLHCRFSWSLGKSRDCTFSVSL